MAASQRQTLDVLVYADVNMNIIDGSSVWLQSIGLALADVDDVAVHVLLKAPILDDRLTAPLSATDVVIHPWSTAETDERPPLSVPEAVERLMELDAAHGFSALVVRGRQMALALARTGLFQGRLWPYLTDVPQSAFTATAEELAELAEITAASRFMLAQTEALRSLLDTLVGGFGTKSVPYPPVVPNQPTLPEALEVDGSLNLVYSGKFARDWMTEEMCQLPETLARRGVEVRLHMIGDKIHREVDDPGFFQRMGEALRSAPGVEWHGGLPREEALAIASRCHLGLSWRHHRLDQSLEVSTKVLELGSLGIPSIVNRGPIYQDLLGEDYPLFANDGEAVVDLLGRVDRDRSLLVDAALAARSAAAEHTADRATARLARLLDRVRPVVLPDAPRRILVASHDLKFFGDVARELERLADVEVRFDHWTGLSDHDETTSRELLAWADLVICEWSGPNAIWYASNMPDSGTALVVRLHRFELDAGYPSDVDIEAVDAVVVVSEQYRALVSEQYPDWAPKLVVIPNSVDPLVFDRPKTKEARFVLGMVGVVPKLKRLDLALDALRSIRLADERFTLRVKSRMPWELPWIWRNPEESDHYKDQLRRIQGDPLLSGFVRLDPPGSDVGSWFRDVGHVLSLSDLESFHLAVAEGMTSGAVPSLLAWEGARDIYGDGWIHDDVDALAAYVRETGADDDRWSTASAAARVDAAPYSTDAVMGLWRDLLSQVGGRP